MLYERWQQVTRAHRSELALMDAASGRRWSFQELARVGEQAFTQGNFVSPSGHSPEFVFAVLRAWRHGHVVCPLESGQSAPDCPAPAARIVHLKLTSATTGPARLVAFTAEQLAADAQNIVATMGLRPDWPNLGIISLAHSYGFSNLVLPLLLHGIPLIIAGPPLPEIVRQSAELAPAITLPAVPALWRTWHEAQAIPEQLRLGISAGAPLPSGLEHAIFSATGHKIHNFYGASECGGIAYDASTEPRTDAAHVGSPMHNVSLRVAEDGCLVVSSGAVAEGYWPEADERLGRGVFRTSDLAEILDGQIFLRGRFSDLINVAGRKVAPETIERELAAHPQVRECLVFGVTSSHLERGETIVACVVPSVPISADTLRQYLLGRLPSWQVPREWLLVDALAVDNRGKLSRTAWRQRFLDQKR